MRKKAILALMLALVMLLSGCALVVKDEAVDAATEIIRMGDQVVTKAEVQKEVQRQLDSMAYTSYLYGSSIDVEDPSVIAQAQEAAITALERDMVSRAKLKEFGIELTEEEEAQAQEAAQNDYNSALEYVKNNMLADSGLEGDALDAAAAERLVELDATLDVYLDDERDTILDRKLKEYVVKDVAVTAEELDQEYQDKVSADKETYESNAGSYASAVNNGRTVYYAPEGVRRVKQILTKFHEEDQTRIDDANAAVTTADGKVSSANSRIADAQAVLDDESAEQAAKDAAQTDLDAANADLSAAQTELDAAREDLASATDLGFLALDEETDAILAELEGGADWDALMAEKNQDPGMQSGVTAEKGYAVSADMTGFDPAFVEAAMNLEKIGDISGKVRGESYGYYIIKYFADEPAGEIGLDAVRETLESSLLSTKQDETFEAAIQQWIDEAGFRVDRNSLNN